MGNADHPDSVRNRVRAGLDRAVITIGLTVAGRPRPKGSLKCLGGAGGRRHVMVEQVEGSKPWKLRMIAEIRREFGIQPVYRAAGGARVVVAWKSTRDKGGPGVWTPYAGAVEVTATFLFERTISVAPKTLGEVIPSHQTDYPTADDFGDLDKLQRNLGDALQQSGLISEDRNIVTWIARKRWADKGASACVTFNIGEAPE